MSDWKPKPGEDAVIRVAEVHGDIVYVTSYSIPMHVAELRPLPPTTLSADDAAVLAAAKAWADLWQDDAHLMERGIRKEVHRLLTAVRARAAHMAPTDLSQQIVAAREAVVSAALKQEHKDAACRGGRGMIPTYVAACIRTTEAARALRALLSPPTPPDPVRELREAATSVDAVIDGLLAEAAADVAGMTPARLHVATEAAHRLRAAIAAMGEKG